MNFKSKSFLVFLFPLLVSCYPETTIKGYLLIEQRFKLVNESDLNGESIEPIFNWNKTNCFLHKDFNFEICFTFLSGLNDTISGTYKIYIDKTEKNGNGVLNHDTFETKITYENSYFLTLNYPLKSQDSTCERILKFQKWGTNNG